MIKKSAMSPAASGAAGTLFEYRIGAIVLSYLPSGTYLPGLSVPIVGALQQRVRGHLLDDIMVDGELDPHPLCTDFQVKRTLRCRPVMPISWRWWTQALHALKERGEEAAAW